MHALSDGSGYYTTWEDSSSHELNICKFLLSYTDGSWFTVSIIYQNPYAQLMAKDNEFYLAGTDTLK